MKPLKNRCLVLSVMAHALLLIVILVGSAFKSPQLKTLSAPFELTDFKLTDLDLNTGAANSGRQPNLAPPRPAPAQSQSATAPNPVRTPDLSSRPRIIPIDPKNVHRRTVQTDVENAPAASPTARTELAQQKFQQALRNLSDGLSGATVVTSPGPNNVAYLNYGAYLKRLYEQSWIPPAAALGQEPAVEVEVTISKVGQVLSTRVLKKSGRPNLDNSVQNVLDRVKTVQPFPEGSTDQQRTFKINFNLTAKLAAG
jgi:TonB family protein